MTMPGPEILYLFWLAPFAFGALAFITLVIFYWRQLRQQRGAGGVFGVFTAVCAISFLLNIAAQADRFHALISPALDLADGLLPPLLLHLVYGQEQRGSQKQRSAAWLLNGFYAIAIVVAGAMAAGDMGLLPETWADGLEGAPALLLGASGLLGILLQMQSNGCALSLAERRYRAWTRLLLGLILPAAAATLFQLSPLIRLLPDYLLLAFFCLTLYYKERLVFFDLVLKRGAFMAFWLLVLAAVFLVRPRESWGRWLVLSALWLTGPWIYGLLARTVDRVWLGRRYTDAEAERIFVAAVQAAENREDLRTRAADALTGIFDAPAEVVFGFVPPPDCAGMSAPIGSHGWAMVSPRSHSQLYLSDDRNLLQSLSRTLGMVLENVQFREREEQLRNLATRAELKALRARINPHFLFNALNAIAGLIQTRPSLAEETVEQLAEVFRYTLRKSEKEWVRLDEEIEFVAAYLRVEEARFGARLQVTVSVDPAASAIPVPAMSIQPLVENAIKHGTSTVEGLGTIRLTVAVVNETLCIQVCDNGPGFPIGFSLDSPGEGHGLRNIADRLSGYYGGSASLSWESHDGEMHDGEKYEGESYDGGTRVWLKIPRRTLAAAAARSVI
jgi:signal transduction histidine kinase